MKYYEIKVQRTGCGRFDPVDFYCFHHLENAITFIEKLTANTEDEEIKKRNEIAISAYKKEDFRPYAYMNSFWCPIELYIVRIPFQDES